MSEIDKLLGEMHDCSKCPRLVVVRRQILGPNHHPILPAGDIESSILIVGQAPGRMKPPANYDKGDVKDRPFAIGSGDMLDQCLAHVGLTRNNVFICNILNCNTPETKEFTDAEIANCKPYLKRIVDIQHPKIIVALGKFALQHVGGNMNMKDGDYQKTKNGTFILYLYHPAYIQRNMSYKNLYMKHWEVLNTLMPKKSSLKELMGSS